MITDRLRLRLLSVRAATSRPVQRNSDAASHRNGSSLGTEDFFYYSFSRKEALPVLYPALSYEIFQLLTYDPSWLYLYCDDSILRMSRSTGETEVLLDTIPEDVTFSYFAVDPEYFYMEDTMFPL